MNSNIGIPTRYGIFVAIFSETGLCRLEFPKKAIKSKIINKLTCDKKSWFNITTSALNKILLGKVPNPLPPLDLSKGTKFQRNVWQTLLKIPTGKTKSYGNLAALLNSQCMQSCRKRLWSQSNPYNHTLPPSIGSKIPDWRILWRIWLETISFEN